MGNASQRVWGKFLNPDDLTLSDTLLFAQCVSACAMDMAADERKAT
jgi:hypothetical protein